MTALFRPAESQAASPWMLRGLARLPIRFIAWLIAANERRRQRQALELLNEHHLRDIGLTRADVERECSRKFWQA